MKVVNKPVEVIAAFTPQGTIRPVRFRMIDSDDRIQVIPVKKVVEFGEHKIGRDVFITFRCQSYVNGIYKDYELRFDKAQCKWTLFKI